MDCGGLYKGFMERFSPALAAMPADRLANIHRLALRAYDACTAGDEFNAKSLFDQLDREAR
jgi:hypothetical protein